MLMQLYHWNMVLINDIVIMSSFHWVCKIDLICVADIWWYC